MFYRTNKCSDDPKYVDMNLSKTETKATSANDRTEVEVCHLRVHSDSLREQRTELERWRTLLEAEMHATTLRSDEVEGSLGSQQDALRDWL